MISGITSGNPRSGTGALGGFKGSVASLSQGGITSAAKYMVSIEESIKDILITPLGSRVMRPEYGSLLYTLIDRKIDDDFKIKLTRYTAEAISKWEKRVKLKGVRLNECKDNKLSITLLFENYGDLTMELSK